MKKAKKEIEKCVVVGEQDATLADLFDLSEREWEVIAKECQEAEDKAKSVRQLAAGTGIYGGGRLALRGYLFGRIIAQKEMEHNIHDMLAALASGMRGEDDGD